MAQQVQAMGRLAPSLSLVARNRYNRHRQDLEEAGATVVVDEETLMGEMLSRRIVDCLADEDCTLLACRRAGKKPADLETQDAGTGQDVPPET